MTHRGTSVARLLGALGVICLLVAGGCTQADSSPSPAPTPSASGATAVPAPASTPVPAPTPGDIRSTVKPQRVERLKPVALNQPGNAADGVRIILTAVQAITAKAVGPGEVTGPALRVNVSIQITTADRLDLGAAVVTLTDAKGGPGASMGGPPASPLPVQLEAGGQATGVYVFAVAKRVRNPVTIDASLGGSPTVVFQGLADD